MALLFGSVLALSQCGGGSPTAPQQRIETVPIAVTPLGGSMFTRLWNRGVDLYLRDLHYRAYRNMSAANRIHPGFPDVERVREDCDIKHSEQGYLHREEVQGGVGAGALVALVALAWFGGRWLASAWRRTLRRIIREELAGVRAEAPTGMPTPPRA